MRGSEAARPRTTVAEPVGRGVVDQDDLDVDAGLLERGSDRRPDVVAVVVTGDHDRDARATGRQLRGPAACRRGQTVGYLHSG